MNENFKAGFVTIIGKPNAGKSTLLNAIIQDKLAIVSPKVQTTRHRIKGILTESDYQIIFSDTPGIITPEYKLHKSMMNQVKSALDDSDLVLYLLDKKEISPDEIENIKLQKIKKSTIVVVNKKDLKNKNYTEEEYKTIIEEIKKIKNVNEVIEISAVNNTGIKELLKLIVTILPQHHPYFSTDEISDRPVKFFVSEIIREKLFLNLQEEIPYHTTVLVEEYKEKVTLHKIVASVVVTRETQKSIVIGNKGSMIKKIGQEAREEIEKFVDSKVFLELHVKVRKDWRNNDLFLNEYGY